MHEVGWWGWESLRDLSKNILKQGMGKGQKLFLGGGGFEGVTTAPPPPKILIVHLLFDLKANVMPPGLLV